MSVRGGACLGMLMGEKRRETVRKGEWRGYKSGYFSRLEALQSRSGSHEHGQVCSIQYAICKSIGTFQAGGQPPRQEDRLTFRW